MGKWKKEKEKESVTVTFLHVLLKMTPPWNRVTTSEPHLLKRGIIPEQSETAGEDRSHTLHSTPLMVQSGCLFRLLLLLSLLLLLHLLLGMSSSSSSSSLSVEHQQEDGGETVPPPGSEVDDQKGHAAKASHKKPQRQQQQQQQQQQQNGSGGGGGGAAAAAVVGTGQEIEASIGIIWSDLTFSVSPCLPSLPVSRCETEDQDPGSE